MVISDRSWKTCVSKDHQAKLEQYGDRKVSFFGNYYYREAREVLARDKDLVKCIMKPEPTFLGEKIPIEGDGTVTHVN